MNRFLPLASLLAFTACDSSQPVSEPPIAGEEPTAGEGTDQAAQEEGGAAPTAAEPERSEPPTPETARDDALVGEDGMPTEAALDALLGERGCRHAIGKLEGRWEVGPAGETEFWEMSAGRVQIERGELREMRNLVAHSSIALELRNAATGGSQWLVLAQDQDTVHFGEGVGGHKTPLGFLIATREHHILVSADRCLAYDVAECSWTESDARYRCELDTDGEALTIERLREPTDPQEADRFVLQLGSGVAVDRALRSSVLRSGR